MSHGSKVVFESKDACDTLFFLRFVSMVFWRKIKKGSSILKLKNKISLFFSFLLLGDHEAFQVGGINESIFNKEFTVGIINFLVCEFVTESDEGVSEPVRYIRYVLVLCSGIFSVKWAYISASILPLISKASKALRMVSSSSAPKMRNWKNIENGIWGR